MREDLERYFKSIDCDFLPTGCDYSWYSMVNIIRKNYPQVNSETKLAFVDDLTIRIPNKDQVMEEFRAYTKTIEFEFILLDEGFTLPIFRPYKRPEKRTLRAEISIDYGYGNYREVKLQDFYFNESGKTLYLTVGYDPVDDVMFINDNKTRVSNA